MTAIANHYGLTIPRTFSREGENPFDSVLWNVRDTQITGSNGDTVFEQKSVHAPEPWSQTAINIVASKYLHGPLGTREREGGVDAMISRVVSTIARWGREGGYFQSQEDAAAFEGTCGNSAAPTPGDRPTDADPADARRRERRDEASARLRR